MHLVELFLPLNDNRGNAFPRTLFDAVERELTNRFGGFTAYPRSPASGLWQSPEKGKLQRDELVIYEVMTEEIDAAWWREYRTKLESVFQQEQLIVRQQRVELL